MVFCAVVGCSSNNMRDKGSYCRIPIVREHEGPDERARTEERRRLWLKAISRADLSEAKQNNQRVCWKHFVNGKAAAPWDASSIDWVPTLNLGHQKFDSTVAAQKREERFERLRCRKKRQLQSLTSMNTVSLIKFKAVVNELEAERGSHLQTKAKLKETQDQLELALGEVEVLQKQLAREKAQFEKTFLLINKKPAHNNSLIVSCSGSESDCQDRSMGDNCKPKTNAVHCVVRASEKRLTAHNPVHYVKPDKTGSKEDEELDTLDSSEDEQPVKDQKAAVFTSHSAAPLCSYIQNSLHKNAVFKTTSAHATVGLSRGCGYGKSVKTSFAKPTTKLKSNAKKIVKQ